MKKKTIRKMSWFAVVWSKIGRSLEPGVHVAKDVRFSRDKAFVMFGSESTIAYVLPRDNVFRTEGEAIEHFTSHGNLKWVVVSKRNGERDVSVHEAFVKKGARTNVWGGQSRDIIRLKTGEIIESSSTAMVFDTEDEALSTAREHYTERLEYIEKELRSLETNKKEVIIRLEKLEK